MDILLGTLTAPLVGGEGEHVFGTVTAVIKNNTIDLSYKLTSQDCILVDKLHVNIVDEHLLSVHPSDFPCHATSNQGMLQNFTCPLNLFDTKCCGTKTMYAQGKAQCAGEVGTLYAGEGGCSGADDWCRTMTIEPPCACGCDETADICTPTSVTCPQCGGEVCDLSECTDFTNCTDTNTECEGQVCGTEECPKKITALVCPAYLALDTKRFPGASRLETVTRPAAPGSIVGTTCASDCCPIGESLQMDLAYKHLFTYSPGHLPGIINAETLGQLESNTELLVKVPGCCPFCEALNNGDCSPVEGKCDACAMPKPSISSR